MRTTTIVVLTLLLIGLLPMWPYSMPSAASLVVGGAAAFAVALAMFLFAERPHHWPR
ncbi:MAG: DUF3309 family protein [Pirellulales bacterium]